MALAWRVVDQKETGEGLLELRQRGEHDFLILIANRVLMNSSANRSEIVLSELACERVGQLKRPRVLVGGLGMAFTLRAALDHLPPAAEVVVAELNPIVVAWCQGPLAPLTNGAVNDPRVRVVIADVAAVIRKAAMAGGNNRFDAIILDLYEGPYEGAKEAGDYLYGEAALALSGAALQEGGVLAIWSEDPDQAFEKRLSATGFLFDRQRPGRGGRRHVVYIARRDSGAGGPGRPRGAAGGARSKR